MQNELFTIRQVARQLRVGEKQVRQWVRVGELVVINLGDSTRSKHRISAGDLQKFIDSRRVMPPEPKATSRRTKSAGRQWF